MMHGGFQEKGKLRHFCRYEGIELGLPTLSITGSCTQSTPTGSRRWSESGITTPGSSLIILLRNLIDRALLQGNSELGSLAA